MQVLLLVAENDGPAMFARIGVMKALNRHVERVFTALETAEVKRETSEAASRDCDPTSRHLPITSSQPNRLRPPARSSAGPARDSSVDCAGLLCFVLAG